MAVCAENVADKPCSFQQCKRSRNGGFMNTKIVLTFGGILLGGCLVGGSAMAASKGGTSQTEMISAHSANSSDSSPYVIACDGVADNNVSAYNDVSYEEQFEPYKQFLLTYDAEKNELQYNSRVVRWFEDYYTVGDNMRAGRDFFNENGVVDIYAVRDFSNIVRAEDGSFDPGGTLVGIKEFTAEEFAARDIEAIKNSSPVVAVAGELPSARELEEMAKEYADFGVTYNAREDQWYYNGEKVRFFRDVMTSNGENLTGGKFKGTIRTLSSADGTIEICTVRDFANLDASGNGTLIGIEKIQTGGIN